MRGVSLGPSHYLWRSVMCHTLVIFNTVRDSIKELPWVELNCWVLTELFARPKRFVIFPKMVVALKEMVMFILSST